MTQEQTAIQIHLYGGEATISVPYWYRGAEAAAIVQQMYALGAVIESATGFSGYDPQLDLSIAEAALHLNAVVACFDQVADNFARRGISSPGNDSP